MAHVLLDACHQRVEWCSRHLVNDRTEVLKCENYRAWWRYEKARRVALQYLFAFKAWLKLQSGLKCKQELQSQSIDWNQMTWVYYIWSNSTWNTGQYLISPNVAIGTKHAEVMNDGNFSDFEDFICRRTGRTARSEPPRASPPALLPYHTSSRLVTIKIMQLRCKCESRSPPLQSLPPLYKTHIFQWCLQACSTLGRYPSMLGILITISLSKRW